VIISGASNKCVCLRLQIKSMRDADPGADDHVTVIGLIHFGFYFYLPR
jgi:hypothetical protein